jgi:hypothetical protein
MEDREEGDVRDGEEQVGTVHIDELLYACLNR